MNKKKAIITVVLILAIIAVILIIALGKQKTIFTVSYEVDGNIIKTENVEEGQTATKPENPTKDGYDFIGWYLSTQRFDFSTEIKENIKLEAKWISKTDENNKTYTITLDVDGETKEVKTNAIGILEDVEEPKKEGYKFLGWYVGDGKVDLTKPFDQNTTIVAKWEKEETKKETSTSNSNTSTTKPGSNTTDTSKKDDTTKVTNYTVKFNSNGGSSVSSQTVEKGKTATEPSNPTKEGYVFKGWYLNNTEYDFTSKVTKNITLNAKWEKAAIITYKIEDVEGSIVGQAKVYVLKDGVKVAGYADITTSKGTQVAEIPATGFDINKAKILKVENARLTK